MAIRPPLVGAREPLAPVAEQARRSALPAAELELRSLSAFYGRFQALVDVSFPVHRTAVTAIIGPSGCGKSTLIRCLNRMHELTPGARVTGQVFLEGIDIYGPDVDPARVRQ
ncbi:MAG: ATP-binding cassette domain-containing protein, partial [Thermomicrobium sp.]|nr:ATP-binding cassette domain-containing protein [Thermomicrobium sp.]